MNDYGQESLIYQCYILHRVDFICQGKHFKMASANAEIDKNVRMVVHWKESDMFGGETRFGAAAEGV